MTNAEVSRGNAALAAVQSPGVRSLEFFVHQCEMLCDYAVRPSGAEIVSPKLNLSYNSHMLFTSFEYGILCFCFVMAAKSIGFEIFGTALTRCQDYSSLYLNH